MDRQNMDRQSDASPVEAALASRRLAIFGVTGTIGLNTLDVIEQGRAEHGPDAFPVEVISAHQDVMGLAEAARRIGTRRAVIGDDRYLGALAEALSNSGVEVSAGRSAVIEAASIPVDWTMAAIVGSAGLAPLLASLAQGSSIALANKEALICAGHLCLDAARQSGAAILPVDSEHNGVFQVFEPEARPSITKVTLTASGGPFRQHSAEAMKHVSVDDAVAHPNWKMGAKISVDSATLINKGLELIEAHHLFNLDREKLGAVVHPQSIIHALVSYADGSVLAQLAAPDMRTPIAHALAYPLRSSMGGQALDINALSALTFEPIDHGRFRGPGLALDALEAGPAGPLILNAANEIAVHAFLSRRIGFSQIVPCVEETLENAYKAGLIDVVCHSLGEVERLDTEIREMLLARLEFTPTLYPQES
jgi:1-deoxy-D-xylulose-5-phosphate reductoisomerase